ncbi:MAG: 1-deoxy-D-xylulose-5-phosphate synthase, partial [Catenulispora sp.]|nr:1-deoxy-D-xylulose-5-phosphate synthase [Catenulispora sp.]
MLRMQPEYERILDAAKDFINGLPVVGRTAYSALHAVKAGLKDAMSPQELFGDLGVKYVGPIDGHDQQALETALRRAKAFGGPVVVHAVTHKGMGYEPAENHKADQMHGPGPFDPLTGKAVPSGTSAPSWTSLFSRELIRHGEQRDDIVAITAAMPGPTGLAAFGERFPERMFDVGIAEQHAVTSAAGLALGGLHPVVALYSTFLNRAFDQMLMDVALLELPVTFELDRSGVTGPDGASHNGVWDLSILGIVPGMRVAAPRDASSLVELFGEALAWSGGPTALRFPKGTVGADVAAVERIDGVDVLAPKAHVGGVLLVTVGPFASVGVQAAAALEEQGIGVTVVDPRWVLPVPDAVVKLAGEARLVVTLEDSSLHGGIGSAVAARLRAAGVDVPIRNLGVPQRFLDHASRGEVHAELGLTAPDVARRITDWLAALGR